ncbi:MAG: IreB family regulatory phosphoprotein, partial [Clostridia bacterium]|nr:IreB family regulatory phosphoprotein [Clostridia bacterium]
MSNQKEIKQLYDIANAMKKAGYDPYEQMYGYWKTGQILYVTRT